MKPPSTRRTALSPAEAADRVEVIKDNLEDVQNSINELLSNHQLSALAAPSLIQSRRLLKHALEHLTLAVELIEREAS